MNSKKDKDQRNRMLSDFVTEIVCEQRLKVGYIPSLAVVGKGNSR